MCRFYFQAITAETTIQKNVVFNIPRAGINFNDGTYTLFALPCFFPLHVPASACLPGSYHDCVHMH